MSEFDIILDKSQQNLIEVPKEVLDMSNLRMLYLQRNFLKELPKILFLKLPNLCWLDLRNNHLTAIPESIANHQNLENLLLSDNKIEALPISLGLVPKLKVLQVADNPLVYPSSRIVAEGTRAICAYLKDQYDKIMCPPSEVNVTEKVVNIKTQVDKSVGSDGPPKPTSQENTPILTVKSLSKVTKSESGISHKLYGTPQNKILVKSYYDESSPETNSSISVSLQPSKRDVWIAKLKQLLSEQERILQQEKNLQALSHWRQQKKKEPPQDPKKILIKPPYGTVPEYASILTRQEMIQQIDRMIQHNKKPPLKQDIEKLVSDLVVQLKEMNTSYDSVQSDQTEMETATAQIMKVIEMHKKLLKLQKTNESALL